MAGRWSVESDDEFSKLLIMRAGWRSIRNQSEIGGAFIHRFRCREISARVVSHTAGGTKSMVLMTESIVLETHSILFACPMIICATTPMSSATAMIISADGMIIFAGEMIMSVIGPSVFVRSTTLSFASAIFFACEMINSVPKSMVDDEHEVAEPPRIIRALDFDHGICQGNDHFEDSNDHCEEPNGQLEDSNDHFEGFNDHFLAGDRSLALGNDHIRVPDSLCGSQMIISDLTTLVCAWQMIISDVEKMVFEPETIISAMDTVFLEADLLCPSRRKPPMQCRRTCFTSRN